MWGGGREGRGSGRDWARSRGGPGIAKATRDGHLAWKQAVGDFELAIPIQGRRGEKNVLPLHSFELPVFSRL